MNADLIPHPLGYYAAMKVRDVLISLNKHGWYLAALQGSHRQYKHPIEETDQRIRETIEFHIRGLREDGLPIPEPKSHVDYVVVAA